MNNVLKHVLEEELERNLQTQRVFFNEFSKYPKGSLVVIKIHGDKYLYRKYRDGNKIQSIYIGPIGSGAANEAYLSREKYLKYKQDLKELKDEESKLRKTLKIYDEI